MFAAQLEGDTAPSLYAATLGGNTVQPKKLLTQGDDFRLFVADLDVSHQTVLYGRDRGEVPSGTDRGEIWVVPFGGGATHPVAHCTASCRTPRFLADGRIVFVDHGPFLTESTVRVARSPAPDGTLRSSVIFGGPRSLATCSLELFVDGAGGRLAIQIDDELALGADCAGEELHVASATDLTPRKVPLPREVTGYCEAAFDEPGRVYVLGAGCAVAGSIGVDGRRPRFPDPSLVDGRPRRARWTVQSEGGGLVAVPPDGSSEPPFFVLEGVETRDFVFRPKGP